MSLTLNIILFERGELDCKISIHDRRIWHVRKILNCKKNDKFDIGIINGPKGKAWISKYYQDHIKLDYNLEKNNDESLYPVTLIIGHPRPQSLKKIFREVTALGVSEILIIGTDTGEKSYYQSKIWKNEKYRKYLIEGAEQAHSTRIPNLERFNNLTECIKSIKGYNPLIALDNIAPQSGLSKLNLKPNSHPLLAIGSERGWSDRERDILTGSGFQLCSLGKRILRTETATVAGTTLLLEKLNIL